MNKKAKQPARNQTQPRDLDRWQEKAKRRVLVGDYASAIATAHRILRAPLATPKQRAQAYDLLGAACTQRGQFEEAFAAVTEAVALNPHNAVLWFNRGITARYTTRLGQSLHDFERAAALDTAGRLAEQLAEAVPFARELAERERALRGPNFTLDQLIEQEALFQHAVHLMTERRWAEAEPLFRQSIAMGDVMPQPWGNLGLCLLMQRRFDDAEAALRRAIEIDPQYELAHQNLAVLPRFRNGGVLPPMRVNTTFNGEPANVDLALLLDGDGE